MVTLADAANAVVAPVAAPSAAPGGVPLPGGPAGAAGPGGCAGGDPLRTFAPMILIFIVFYFMLIRPQQKKQKDTQDWLKNLKKDDEVVTSGGVLGKITGLNDSTVTLEVQEKVRLKVLRSAISGPAPSSSSKAPGSAPAK
ncbi:MAG: preprotein translocase subunit YajC [Myxococcales bacterium]|nr:preprotein translocase subunit YajC [Myxococcales bacterium]